jgi:hypothetical protein
VRGGGELILWTDHAGRVVAFQLSHEPWPRPHQYVADWRAGSALRIGEVEEDEPTSRARVKPAPVMRFGPGTDPQAAGSLLRYFRANAAALPLEHSRLIATVLGEGSGG